MNLRSIGYFVLGILLQGTFARADLGSHYQLVVSGAGPGGLAAALAALQNSVPAEKILVVEKRQPGEDYATRGRVVVLDGVSEHFLSAHMHSMPGVDIRHMVAHLEDGSPRHFPHRALWRRVIESMFGGRRLARLASLKSIEESLLAALRGRGVRVVFGQSLEALPNSNSDLARLRLGGREFSADLVAVFEGARSGLAQRLQRQSLAEKSTSHFLSVDLRASSSHRIQPGDIFAFKSKADEAVVYAFSDGASTSVNLMVSKPFADSPSLRQAYDRLLLSVMQGFGIAPGNQGSPWLASVPYEGRLTHLELVMMGPYMFGGDAVRTVDPISGTGANSAFLDALVVGQYFSDLANEGVLGARRNLVDSVQRITTEAFGLSLFFREMSEAGLKHSGWIDRLWSFGLRGRSGMGSKLDLAKSVYAGFWGMVYPPLEVGESGNWIEKLLAKEQSWIGVQPPFSQERLERQIGRVHPKAYQSQMKPSFFEFHPAASNSLRAAQKRMCQSFFL